MSSPRTSPWRRVLGLLLCGLLIAAAGCSPSPDGDAPEEIEVVDVAPRLEVETAEDPQAVARSVGLSGVLPVHFPDGLAIYLPSTLVDFEDESEGWNSVSLLTAETLEAVRLNLRHDLATAGWQVAPASDSVWELSRGGERARLRFEDANPGTRYHYEYP